MDGWKVVLSRAKQPVRIHRSVTSRTFYLDESKQEGSREKAWRTCFHIITDESSKIVPAQQTKRLFLVDMHNSNQEEGLRNLASSL
jgi:hypothetical protein